MAVCVEEPGQTLTVRRYTTICRTGDHLLSRKKGVVRVASSARMEAAQAQQECRSGRDASSRIKLGVAVDKAKTVVDKERANERSIVAMAGAETSVSVRPGAERVKSCGAGKCLESKMMARCRAESRGTAVPRRRGENERRGIAPFQPTDGRLSAVCRGRAMAGRQRRGGENEERRRLFPGKVVVGMIGERVNQH